MRTRSLPVCAVAGVAAALVGGSGRVDAQQPASGCAPVEECYRQALERLRAAESSLGQVRSDFEARVQRLQAEYDRKLADQRTALDRSDGGLSQRVQDLGEKLGRARLRVDYENCEFFLNSNADEDLGTAQVLGRWSGPGRTTGRDINANEQCPQDMVLVGLAGGRGHSADWNLPHGLKCCRLKLE